jgi:hypothetical protein
MVLVISLGAAALAGGQSQSEGPRVAALIAGLQAANWADRSDAYEQLRSDPAALRKPEVRSALLDLVDRENKADWSKEPGYDPQYNESHAEYVAELGDTVDSFADWSDPRQVCILAHQAYEPDGAFARKLAAVGQPIVPCLMQMAQSAASDDRYEAVPVLVQLRAKHRTLSTEATQKIRQATVAALHDTEVSVRISAIAALRDFGGQDMLEALQDVAVKDPSPEVDGQSVRKYATRAIAAIQERMKK